jgi:hypothetical protein
MAFRHSAFQALRAMRKAGQRPDGFVVIADNPMSASWGVRNGFCTIPRAEITDDHSPLAGLDALILTVKPFGDVAEFAKELQDTCRYVTIADALHRRRSEFL